MLGLYTALMTAGEPFLEALLRRRCRQGKEDPARLRERMGHAARPRPAGPLVWLHAASVGEAQSALILIEALHNMAPGLHILVTTGTVTSATIMASRLPPYAFHQYYPLDHPAWVKRFLDYWQPDLVLWMESELWPNMLGEVTRRNIPALLLNARLSPRSFRLWQWARGDAARILGGFNVILAQTEQDAAHFRALGAPSVTVSDNLKYTASPLPYIPQELDILRRALQGRPVWLYASTHDGEEEMACRLHKTLRERLPGLLTIIVPRHPERRQAIQALCEKQGMTVRLRSRSHAAPQPGDDIYLADTLGELGLFYRLAPVTCIGRSFSADGGGGHNPFEAAQLACAVLHGPHVQNLGHIYEEMNKAGAALRLQDESDFARRLETLLTGNGELDTLRANAVRFVAAKNRVLDFVLSQITPWLDKTGIRAGSGKETGNGARKECA